MRRGKHTDAWYACTHPSRIDGARTNGTRALSKGPAAIFPPAIPRRFLSRMIYSVWVTSALIRFASHTLYPRVQLSFEELRSQERPLLLRSTVRYGSYGISGGKREREREKHGRSKNRISEVTQFFNNIKRFLALGAILNRYIFLANYRQTGDFALVPRWLLSTILHVLCLPRRLVGTPRIRAGCICVPRNSSGLPWDGGREWCAGGRRRRREERTVYTAKPVRWWVNKKREGANAAARPRCPLRRGRESLLYC